MSPDIVLLWCASLNKVSLKFAQLIGHIKPGASGPVEFRGSCLLCTVRNPDMGDFVGKKSVESRDTTDKIRQNGNKPTTSLLLKSKHDKHYRPRGLTFIYCTCANMQFSCVMKHHSWCSLLMLPSNKMVLIIWIISLFIWSDWPHAVFPDLSK